MNGKDIRDSAREERVRAISAFELTERQARFLVTVMLFSGVCVGRQYCAFAGIVRGQKMYDFFSLRTTEPMRSSSKITANFRAGAALSPPALPSGLAEPFPLTK